MKIENFLLCVVMFLFCAITVLVLIAKTEVIKACSHGDKSACDVMRTR